MAAKPRMAHNITGGWLIQCTMTQKNTYMTYQDSYCDVMFSCIPTHENTIDIDQGLGLGFKKSLGSGRQTKDSRRPQASRTASERAHCDQRHHIANMPPRLQLLSKAARVVPQQAYQPAAPFLYPFLHQQQRPASILSSLSDTKGAYNHRIRRGRGPSSGKGKTSGRGHKGQKQHGKVPFGFQGGQTPEIVVHGERGFVNQYVSCK